MVEKTVIPRLEIQRLCDTLQPKDKPPCATVQGDSGRAILFHVLDAVSMDVVGVFGPKEGIITFLNDYRTWNSLFLAGQLQSDDAPKGLYLWVYDESSSSAEGGGDKRAPRASAGGSDDQPLLVSSYKALLILWPGGSTQREFVLDMSRSVKTDTFMSMLRALFDPITSQVVLALDDKTASEFQPDLTFADSSDVFGGGREFPPLENDVKGQIQCVRKSHPLLKMSTSLVVASVEKDDERVFVTPVCGAGRLSVFHSRPSVSERTRIVNTWCWSEKKHVKTFVSKFQVDDISLFRSLDDSHRNKLYRKLFGKSRDPEVALSTAMEEEGETEEPLRLVEITSVSVWASRYLKVQGHLIVPTRYGTLEITEHSFLVSQSWRCGDVDQPVRGEFVTRRTVPILHSVAVVDAVHLDDLSSVVVVRGSHKTFSAFLRTAAGWTLLKESRHRPRLLTADGKQDLVVMYRQKPGSGGSILRLQLVFRSNTREYVTYDDASYALSEGLIAMSIVPQTRDTLLTITRGYCPSLVLFNLSDSSSKATVVARTELESLREVKDLSGLTIRAILPFMAMITYFDPTSSGAWRGLVMDIRPNNSFGTIVERFEFGSFHENSIVRPFRLSLPNGSPSLGVVAVHKKSGAIQTFALQCWVEREKRKRPQEHLLRRFSLEIGGGEESDGSDGSIRSPSPDRSGPVLIPLFNRLLFVLDETLQVFPYDCTVVEQRSHPKIFSVIVNKDFVAEDLELYLKDDGMLEIAPQVLELAVVGGDSVHQSLPATFGSVPLGNWLKLLICCCPLQIARFSVSHGLRPLCDGRWDSSLLLQSHSDSSSGDIAKRTRFGLLEAVLRETTEQVFCVGVLGPQDSGKSTLLNTAFGTRFAVCTSRCTYGVWMAVRMARGRVYVLLDFEGLDSYDRTFIEEMVLAVFGAALCNAVVLRFDGKNLKHEFLDKWVRAAGYQGAEEQPMLFRGRLVLAAKDAVPRMTSLERRRGGGRSERERFEKDMAAQFEKFQLRHKDTPDHNRLHRMFQKVQFRSVANYELSATHKQYKDDLQHFIRPTKRRRRKKDDNPAMPLCEMPTQYVSGSMFLETAKMYLAMKLVKSSQRLHEERVNNALRYLRRLEVVHDVVFGGATSKENRAEAVSSDEVALQFDSIRRGSLNDIWDHEPLAVSFEGAAEPDDPRLRFEVEFDEDRVAAVVRGVDLLVVESVEGRRCKFLVLLPDTGLLLGKVTSICFLIAHMEGAPKTSQAVRQNLKAIFEELVFSREAISKILLSAHDGEEVYFQTFRSFCVAVARRRQARILDWVKRRLNRAGVPPDDSRHQTVLGFYERDSQRLLRQNKHGELEGYWTVCGTLKKNCSVCSRRCLRMCGHRKQCDCIEETHDCFGLCRRDGCEGRLSGCIWKALHDGECFCGNLEHVCSGVCVLKGLGFLGCGGGCTKKPAHDGDCLCGNAHLCPHECSLEECKAGCIVEKTLEDGLSHGEMIDHDCHCSQPSCENTCSICSSRCCESHLTPHALHLCGGPHACPHLCGHKGICELQASLVRESQAHYVFDRLDGRGQLEYSGPSFQHDVRERPVKLPCAHEIPPTAQRHPPTEGNADHSCRKEGCDQECPLRHFCCGKIHYCPKQCELCGFYCRLPFNHMAPRPVTAPESLLRCDLAQDSGGFYILGDAKPDVWTGQVNAEIQLAASAETSYFGLFGKKMFQPAKFRAPATIVRDKELQTVLMRTFCQMKRLHRSQLHFSLSKGWVKCEEGEKELCEILAKLSSEEIPYVGFKRKYRPARQQIPVVVRNDAYERYLLIAHKKTTSQSILASYCRNTSAPSEFIDPSSRCFQIVGELNGVLKGTETAKRLPRSLPRRRSGSGSRPHPLAGTVRLDVHLHHCLNHGNMVQAQLHIQVGESFLLAEIRGQAGAGPVPVKLDQRMPPSTVVCVEGCRYLGRGHSHLIRCDARSADECDRSKHIEVKHQKRHQFRDDETQFDLVSCNYYWGEHQKIYPGFSRKEREAFRLCGASCCKTPHKDGSERAFCVRRKFHDPCEEAGLGEFLTEGGHVVKWVHPGCVRHTVFIFDNSSSMVRKDGGETTRTARGKEAMMAYIKHRSCVCPQDLVSLVFFAKKARVKFSARSIREVEDSVDLPSRENGTNISAGLLVAFRLADRLRCSAVTDAATTVFVVLTDGDDLMTSKLALFGDDLQRKIGFLGAEVAKFDRFELHTVGFFPRKRGTGRKKKAPAKPATEGAAEKPAADAVEKPAADAVEKPAADAPEGGDAPKKKGTAKKKRTGRKKKGTGRKKKGTGKRASVDAKVKNRHDHLMAIARVGRGKYKNCPDIEGLLQAFRALSIDGGFCLATPQGVRQPRAGAIEVVVDDHSLDEVEEEGEVAGPPRKKTRSGTKKRHV